MIWAQTFLLLAVFFPKRFVKTSSQMIYFVSTVPPSKKKKRNRKQKQGAKYISCINEEKKVIY